MELVAIELGHFSRQVSHNGLCLGMQITEHSAGLPTINLLNSKGIDLTIKKRHGTRYS